MTLTERISKELIAAMKSRDKLRLATLRLAKAALKTREIDNRGALDAQEELKIIHGLVKQRTDSAEQFRAAGRPELAEREEAEGRILREYLPAEVAEAELAQAVERAVAETGAATPKDMGRVMKAALAHLRASGKTVDGGRVSRLVRERLGGH